MQRWLWLCGLWLWGCRGPGYCDRDRDGFAGPRGDCLASELVQKVDGFGDCDDVDREVHPEHDELCDNNIDDDCDSFVDEVVEPDEPHVPPHYQDNDDDGFGDPLTERWCLGEGISAGGDCDDEDPNVYPGSDEFLDNGIDDDCDGIVDLHDPITVPEILLACNAYEPKVDVLGEVTLMAEGIDPYGQTLRYEWSYVAVPQGSECNVTYTSGYYSYEPLEEGQEISATLDCSGPYTFQVIATSEDGRTSEPCFVTVEAVSTLEVELIWIRAGDDLDLHIIAPGGSIEHETLDCYYATCIESYSTDWGVSGDPSDDPELEMDDIVGTGPEVIRLSDPAGGTYRVVVHDYPTTSNTDLSNEAYIYIFIDDSLVWTDTIDVIGEDQYYEIADISFPDQNVTPL